MNRAIMFCSIGLALAGCTTTSKVTLEPAPAVQTKTRSEPIFYNGKTYQLDFSYASGVFDMRVSGMGAGQKKDAVAVATSGLRYFACPDGQSGETLGEPKFAMGAWRLRAKCA